MDVFKKIEEELQKREDIPPLLRFVKKQKPQETSSDLGITHFGATDDSARDLGPVRPEEPAAVPAPPNDSELTGIRELTLESLSSSNQADAPQAEPREPAPETPGPEPLATAEPIPPPRPPAPNAATRAQDRDILVVVALLRKGMHNQAIEVIRRMQAAK
jgi:hypothetical protein